MKAFLDKQTQPVGSTRTGGFETSFRSWTDLPSPCRIDDNHQASAGGPGGEWHADAPRSRRRRAPRNKGVGQDTIGRMDLFAENNPALRATGSRSR